MDRLREFLSRRIYGVPVGVIAVIVAAGFLYIALRVIKKSPEVTAGAATDESTDDSLSGDADPFAGDSGQPIFSASPTTPTVVAVATEDTNDLWAGRARQFLLGQGVSAIEAQATVGKYLNGETLTTREKGLINQVLSNIGYPPEPPDIAPVETTDPTTEPAPVETPSGPHPAGNSSTPPTKQGTPPCMHTIRNARDNGPGELAVLYFGSNNPTIVNKIEAANLDKGAGPWAPGTKIKIPANVQPAYFTATQNTRGLTEIASKNGVSKEYVKTLNPGMDFPVRVGTKVRIR